MSAEKVIRRHAVAKIETHTARPKTDLRKKKLKIKTKP